MGITEDRRGLAALWMIGAIISFTSMAVAGRAISFDLDTFEIMTFRSAFGVLIVTTIALATGHWREISTQRLGLHFLRNIFHFSGQNLWFYGLLYIPLAQLFALEFTAPLWITLAAPFLLGERLSAQRAFAAALGFAGVLVVARPGGVEISVGFIAAALAAIGFAGSAIFTKKLTRTASITCILFWLTVMQLGFGLVAAGYDGDFTLPSAQNLPWLLVIAVAGLTAHFCLTTALGYAPAALVMQMDFARLPAIAVVGMLFYGESLEMFVVLGALIIIAANVINFNAK